MSAKKPIELLKEEHQSIKVMLQIIENVCDKLDAGEDINPLDLEDIVYFIRGFADKCHHAKEEDLLFPAMEACGIPRDGGPIGVMLTEHDEGRNSVKAVKEAVERYKNGDRTSIGQIVRNARQFTTMLRQHIDKEENILYRMAEMHLTEEKKEHLEKEFERVEREVIGIGKHEKFHRILNRLKKTYLK